jgi:hypothetical protein
LKWDDRDKPEDIDLEVLKDCLSHHPWAEDYAPWQEILRRARLGIEAEAGRFTVSLSKLEKRKPHIHIDADSICDEGAGE